MIRFSIRLCEQKPMLKEKKNQVNPVNLQTWDTCVSLSPLPWTANPRTGWSNYLASLGCRRRLPLLAGVCILDGFVFWGVTNSMIMTEGVCLYVFLNVFECSLCFSPQLRKSSDDSDVFGTACSSSSHEAAAHQGEGIKLCASDIGTHARLFPSSLPLLSGMGSVPAGLDRIGLQSHAALGISNTARYALLGSHLLTGAVETGVFCFGRLSERLREGRRREGSASGSVFGEWMSHTSRGERTAYGYKTEDD